MQNRIILVANTDCPYIFLFFEKLIPRLSRRPSCSKESSLRFIELEVPWAFLHPSILINVDIFLLTELA